MYLNFVVNKYDNWKYDFENVCINKFDFRNSRNGKK